MEIFKYRIAPNRGSHSVMVHAGAVFMSAQMQAGDVSVWMLCDRTSEPVRRFFHLLHTGDTLPPKVVYRSTILLADGQYVLHLFEDVTP